ncbi:hypothetical protein BH10PLA2_BH10PLA2_00750 [soil metagenome]
MSQDDLIIEDGDGASVLADLNSAFAALATNSKGTSRPSGCQAGQFWIDSDTPSSTTWSLYVYDGTHDIKLGELDSTGGNFTPFAAGASIVAGGTTNTSSTALATMSNVQASMLGGFINKFRNPAMDIWQRSTSGSVTAGSPAYTADGWIVGCTGANVTWAQVAGRNLTAFALKITGAASVSDALVKQRIESSLAFALAGQRVTVQAKIYNNTGGSITPTITVKHATATDNWTSTATDVSAVNLQACPNTTLTTVAYSFDASASSGNGLEITIDFGNNFTTSGKSVEVSELDIRITPGVSTGTNSSPPVPELRYIAIEMPLNQRYFYKTYPQATAPGTSVGTDSAGAFQFRLSGNTSAAHAIRYTVPYAKPMRATPTVTFYSTDGTSGVIRDRTAASNLTPNATQCSGDRGCVLDCTSGSTADPFIEGHLTASAEL